jgi:hypothetical protein
MWPGVVELLKVVEVRQAGSVLCEQRPTEKLGFDAFSSMTLPVR